MPDAPRGVDALPPDVRDRLARFADRVARVSVERLPMYAARPRDPDHGSTLARAMAAAGDSGRTAAVDDARDGMTNFVMRAFADNQYRPTIIGLNWGQSAGSTEDRVAVSRSLAEAVVALALWDVLDEGDRDELLGAWASLAA